MTEQEKLKRRKTLGIIGLVITLVFGITLLACTPLFKLNNYDNLLLVGGILFAVGISLAIIANVVRHER